MTEKRFSSKKYGEYPVIIDTENNTELTLDSVVELLNDYEYMRKRDIQEHNSLHRQTDYVISEKRRMREQRDRLMLVVSVMVLIIVIMAFLIALGVI